MNIKGYEIGREIGQGGMATVYLARQVLLDRQVALKVVDPSLGREQGFLVRFLDEGKIMARLEHPNIARVYDVGLEESSQTAYMAMEYLPGGSLKERLVRGQLPLAEALTILEQIGAGLGLAHEQNFIHRDIKPGNILFRRDGSAVLTDFGIAKLQDSMGDLTRMGYTLGTAQYMSPEQASSTKLDRRSDIYSLGLVFFEMLTGKKAFAAESTAQAIYNHVTQPPPLLPVNYAYLQPVLNTVLAKSPDNRYATVAAFLTAVHAALPAGKVLPAYSSTATQVVVVNKPKFAYRPLVVSSVLGLLLIGTFAAAFYAANNWLLDNDSLVASTPTDSGFVVEKLNVVVDASDSMNAKLEGIPRIEMVRNALRTIASTWDDTSTSRGLWVYGSNKSGSCQDITPLVLSNTNNKEEFLSQLGRLEAKGMAPLNTALTQALEDVLLHTSDNNRVFLISSGKDNCGGDPCAKVKELKNSNNPFKVHVIGLGVQDAAAQAQLRCIADATGGIYQTANSATTLQQVWEGIQSGKIIASSVGESIPVVLPTYPTNKSVTQPNVSNRPTPKPKEIPKSAKPPKAAPPTAKTKPETAASPAPTPATQAPADKATTDPTATEIKPPSDNKTPPAATASTPTDKPQGNSMDSSSKQPSTVTQQEPDKPPATVVEEKPPNKTPIVVNEKKPVPTLPFDKLKVIPNWKPLVPPLIPVTPKPQADTTPKPPP